MYIADILKLFDNNLDLLCKI